MTQLDLPDLFGGLTGLPGVTITETGGGTQTTVTIGGAAGTDLPCLAWIAPGADLTAPWQSWPWVDISDLVRWDPGIEVTFSGRRERSDRVETAIARATLDNTSGDFSPVNVFGQWYGLLNEFTPIMLGLDPGTGPTWRFQGFVNEWPRRWDRSGRNPTVPITCSGSLRRVQRNRTLKSALNRTIAGVAPDASRPYVYWPLEDGTASTAPVAQTADTPNMGVHGSVTFAAESSLPGSSPLLTLDAGSNIAAQVPAYTHTGQWIVQFAVNMASKPAARTTLCRIYLTNSSAAYVEAVIDVVTDPCTINVTGVDETGTVLFDAGFPFSGTDDPSSSTHPPSEAEFFGHWYLISVAGVDSDPDWVCDLGYNSGNGKTANGAVGVSGSGSLLSGEPYRILLYAGANPTSFGHLAVYTDPAISLADSQFYRANGMYGWTGEQAHERMTRVCREEGITFYTTATRSAPLGPQPTGKMIDILRDGEKADQGVLYEHEFGLGYQALSQRYNAPVAAVYDVALGHISDDVEPAYDDLRFNNQWTVSRTNGATVTVQAGDGLGPTDLVYEGSDTFGVQTDAQLPSLGKYLANRDSSNQEFWPNLGINLMHHPELVTGWIDQPYGARINMINKSDVDTVDAFVEGHSEHWNSRQWSAVMNSTPVGFLGDTGVYSDRPDPRRYDSRYSTLTADISSSATSVGVTVSAGQGWITTATHPTRFPFNVTIGGLVYSCTAITGAMPTYTFTLIRLASDKDHSAGDPIHVYRPARYAR